jgi:hypothetical protein
VKDYQDHVVATLFGRVTIRLPRFRCSACCGSESGINWPSHCRSTPELDRLQAHLAALMTYRTAADLLAQMFPVDAAKHPETLRRHALKVGEAIDECATAHPQVAAAAVVMTLDSTFIRSCEKAERHLEVRVGNVETTCGGRQVFGAVAKAESDLAVLINRNLDAIGRTEHTALTAFTDGCAGTSAHSRGRRRQHGAVSRLVPHWNETSAPAANRQRSVVRRSVAVDGKGCDRRGS